MQQKLFVVRIFSLIVLLTVCPSAQADVGQVLFSEDFEACIPPDWSVDNGVWDCCLRSEPDDWGGGFFYAGTVCGANYPRYTDSRLISPEIDLTAVTPTSDEEIVLRFWHTFSYPSGDYGVVQISVYDETAESWSAWTEIGGRATFYSSVWSPKSIDLTAYASRKVKIAFFHVDDGDLSASSGWYIDNVEINLRRLISPGTSSAAGTTGQPATGSGRQAHLGLDREKLSAVINAPEPSWTATIRATLTAGWLARRLFWIARKPFACVFGTGSPIQAAMAGMFRSLSGTRPRHPGQPGIISARKLLILPQSGRPVASI